MSNIATAFLENSKNPEPLFFDILLRRSENNPDQKAFTFVNNGQDKTLTYYELDRNIRRLAAYFQQKNLKGERALLFYPPGFDYIIGYFACLYSGIIAVPVYPPESSTMEKTLPRIHTILKDSEAKIALSTESVINEVRTWQKNILADDENSNRGNKSDFSKSLNSLFNIEWLATDIFEENLEDNWCYPDLKSNDIAYLQYTSGSTGNPKGVMITHDNLIHNTKLIYHGFELNKEDHEGVIWLPIYHDMGLVGGILEPILAGFHCTLLSPIDFLKNPFKWLRIISDIKDKPIVSGGPNFAYDLCMKVTTEKKRAELDLSNWKVAFTGAEPVRAETISQFADAFQISGFNENAFYPCYGLAEGTLIVSGSNVQSIPKILNVDKDQLKNNIVVSLPEEEEGTKLVGSGKSILDLLVRVVNPETGKTCPEMQVGEIWSLSKSNAVGYWKDDQLSSYTFNAFTSDTKEGPFLRTGDLGFIFNGELFITGRLKDLIIIRGNNHYPQDIELTSERSSRLLRPGRVAAFSIDIENEEKLVIVQEARAKQNVEWSKVCEDIKSEVLSEHNISPYKIILIKPKSIFLTSSGKIQRKATKDAFLGGKLEIIYEWTSDEKSNISVVPDIVNNQIDNSKTHLDETEIAKIIAEKLAAELHVDPKSIDNDMAFTDFGLDSAKSLILVGKLESIVDQNLDPTILWNYPTINKLAKFIHSQLSGIQNATENHENERNDDFTKKVEELSEEEAAELLLKKLNENK